MSITRFLPLDQPLPLFRWRTNDGVPLTPAEMKTPHLFHTVCMLWHHTMPPDAVLHLHKRWRLGPRFTESYTRGAIRILLTELINRDHDHWPTIEKMFAYLHRNQPQLHKGPLRIAP